MQFGVSKHKLIFQRQQYCICVTTLHSYYMKNGLVFSKSDARNFFITFSYTQIESEISDQVTNEYTPTRKIVTGKANERFVSMPSAKKQRKHSTTSRVPPYISFVLQLLAAALQQNKVSLFVNVTHSTGAIHAWNYCHLKYLLFSAK